MSAININNHNFEAIKLNDKPILLDFYADWCGPCRILSLTIDKIAAERDDIVVGKVNIDIEKELAVRFNILSIPTLVVIKKGKVVNKLAGAHTKAKILAMLEK